MSNINVMSAIEDMSLINPAYVSRRKAANRSSLYNVQHKYSYPDTYIFDEREVECYVPCLRYPNSIFTVSQMSFMHHET